MSDADKAAYIDAQVQAKTESANAAITAAEKTITDNQKLFDEFFEKNPDGRYFYATTKAPHAYHEVEYRDGDYLMFGKETAGLPEWLREKYRSRCIRIPMREDARSLNLANSVAILTYEALKQNGFPGLSGVGSMAAEE